MSLRPIFVNSRILFRYTAICLDLCPCNFKDMIMRGKVALALMALLTMSCSKEGMVSHERQDYEYGRSIPHEGIVLGDRLNNPYTTENITKALNSLYPTKAGRVDVRTTNLYVRFLPQNEDEFGLLKGLVTDLMDHPLDFDILVEGDWYHDPEIAEGCITWQYAVVPHDFKFPEGIRHEIIDECHITEHETGTRADGIDWEAVEKESYRLTGNEDRICYPATKAAASAPEGRLVIVDEDYCGGKPIGISGVRVSCNSFVKFSHAYTDRDGYYRMERKFSSDLRYRIIFKNEKDFSIGFNMILVPASVSTLGKAGPEGIDMTVTQDSDDKLFRRSVVNNAAYDYISRCGPDDMNLPAPPAGLTIWIFNFMEASSAVMLRHGAVVESELIASYLGQYSKILSCFLPDITVGTKGNMDYDHIYSSVCHELAHASHFMKAGTEYWNKYIRYIIESYLETGGNTYGDGMDPAAGYCGIGEMWAYYLESKMYKDRYGGGFPTFGTSYWFHPQIFRYLDERGLKACDILSVLDGNVASVNDLREALITSFPDWRNIIEQVFSRY